MMLHKKLIIFLCILFCHLSFAQDHNSNHLKKETDSVTLDWFQAKYIKFKPSKVAEARELLAKYLYKANEISGRLVLTFESDMGEWDHIAYLHLKDGPKQLNDTNAEIEKKWWEGVVKLSGSEKKAQDIITAYQNCILNEKHTLVKMRNMLNQMSRKE